MLGPRASVYRENFQTITSAIRVLIKKALSTGLYASFWLELFDEQKLAENGLAIDEWGTEQVKSE